MTITQAYATATATPQEIEQRVRTHMQLVRKIAWQIHGRVRDVFEIDDLAKEAICLVLGAEGNGLSRLVRDRCDLIVSIPMRGRLSSLNVSAAAALATYEVTRHRAAR
jgi:tRNA G18 (ribose-2'-O)-methylase SpoU